MSRSKFPSPYTLENPKGSEGWEDLYAYNLVFQDALKSEEESKFWFCDSQHWPNALKPFETIGVEFAVKCLGQYNARHLLIPPANGIEFRVHQGYVYMSPVPVPPEEIGARVPEFMARAGHYFMNWNDLLDNWKNKVRGVIDEIEAINFEPLPDKEPMDIITGGIGLDSTDKLLYNYDRLIELLYKNWQYHFEFLNLGYAAYLDFFVACQTFFPGIPDQGVAKMVQGAEIELFRPDEELKELSKFAVELGIQDLLTAGKSAEQTLADIKAHPMGARWLVKWEEAHHPWFNFTVGNGFYSSDKYWNEHPELPLGYIASYVERLVRGENIDRPIDALIEERKRVISEYGDLLDDAQRAEFEGKLGLAMTVYPYVENHNFYIEHWTMGAFWRKMRQLSKILHEAGFWPNENDMFYLRRDEVREVLFDYATGWAVGAKPVGPSIWPKEVERRRTIIDALDKKRPEPALNEPPAVITEPFTIMLWGITSDRVQSWLGGDDESGDIVGMAASPGVVEGIARIINSPDELDSIQDGDILVAPVTAPSWGPVFGKIKATVTDIGGMMSHAAIVCREYNLPAVTGTGSASTRIQSGMRIRVDGTQGRVTILSEA